VAQTMDSTANPLVRRVKALIRPFDSPG
jgi:hypothetical protein